MIIENDPILKKVVPECVKEIKDILKIYIDLAK